MQQLSHLVHLTEQPMQKELIACEDIEEGLLGAWAAVKREKAAGDVVLNTRVKAKQGDVESMLMLARWYLFGADGFDLDANQGYEWCKLAAQQGNWVAKGYQGGCQILGCGAKENWEDGFELLVEVASQDDSDEARGELCPFCSFSLLTGADKSTRSDFAAHTLACYYKHRGTGDKRDMKKVNKWMAKVQKTPMFSLDKSLPWNDSPDGTAESQLYHEQRISELSGSSMLVPGGLPKKEGYGHDRDDLSEVTATTCSVSNYSSSTSTSSSSGVSSRVCEKCSGALPHPTVDNSYVPAKLCRACKVISSDKFSL